MYVHAYREAKNLVNIQKILKNKAFHVSLYSQIMDSMKKKNQHIKV